MSKDLPAPDTDLKAPVLDNVDTTRPSQPIGHPLFNFIVQFLIVAVLFFSVGFAIGQKGFQFRQKSIIPKISVTGANSSKNQSVDFSLFWNVFDTLPQKYLDKSAVDGQKMMYGAISGMVRSLGDPYTAFLDPKQNESIKSEIAGSYEGVGIQLGFDRDKRLVVMAPLRGTPAEREGVQARDLILKIDDKEAFDLTLPEAVDLIRGPAGTKVKITFARDGREKSFDRTIERAKIDVKTVNLDFKQVNGREVAVIEVSRFGEKTDSEWDSAVTQVVEHGSRGVIVDMRNNPGGLLSSAIHLAGDFVKGTVVKQEFADGRQESLPSDHEGRLLKIPVVVLVNAGSASAAEIFSGAVQDYKRGKLVGEKTFGKGTVQDVIELPGGSGLHVTIAKWLTPKGNSIHHVGITPDVAVERSSDDIDKKLDPQMEKALAII